MLLRHKSKYHISIGHNKIEDYIIDLQKIEKGGILIFYCEESKNYGKKLVAYFSASGTTKKTAEIIAETANS